MAEELAMTGEEGALAQAFVQFALESGVLRFGQFKTKAGRMSPYFFNAGLFDDGAKLARLAANRAHSPLFDTPRLTRDLESAFEAMHARRLQGLPPEHIRVVGAVPDAPSST